MPPEWGDPKKIQLRRRYAYEWEADNTLLIEGEIGVVRGTSKFKLGDGVRRWLELDTYQPVAADGTSDAAILAHVNSVTPHPVYDDGPDLALLYQNAKV